MSHFPSVAQLQRALELEQRINALKAELTAIWNGPAVSTPETSDQPDRRKGKRSAATRARMAAAQRARWAKKRKQA